MRFIFIVQISCPEKEQVVISNHRHYQGKGKKVDRKQVELLVPESGRKIVSMTIYGVVYGTQEPDQKSTKQTQKKKPWKDPAKTYLHMFASKQNSILNIPKRKVLS